MAGCSALLDKGGLPSEALAIAHSRRSDLHLESGNFDAGIADRARVVELQPEDAAFKLRLSQALTLRAGRRLEAGDLDAAIADHSEVIRLDAANDEAYIARSSIYARIKKYEHAIADLQTVARLQGETPVHRAALAKLYEQSATEHLLKKDFDPAITDFTEALRYTPKRDDLLINRGMARAGKNDLDGAAQDYAEAAKVNPENPETYVRRGELARAMGHLSSAALYFSEAIKREPRNVTALMLRGLAREETRQFDEAMTDYRAVLAIDPSHKLATTSLERLRGSKSPPPNPVAISSSAEPRLEVRKSAAITPTANITPAHSQGIVDGRWTGEWDGLSATTILISGGKVVRYRFRGREVPITRTQVAGKTITFGSATYTVRVTFESAQRASAHYQNLTRGFTSSAVLSRQ